MSSHPDIRRASKSRLAERILGPSGPWDGNSMYQATRERAKEALMRLADIDLEALELCVRTRAGATAGVTA